jgi:hypothetical protein
MNKPNEAENTRSKSIPSEQRDISAVELLFNSANLGVAVYAISGPKLPPYLGD